MIRLRGKPNAFTLAVCSMRSMSSALPIKPLTGDAETSYHEERVAEVADFFKQPRFKNLTRPYSPADVASKQGSLSVVPPASNLLSDKLHTLLTEAEETKIPVHTMGAVDPVQMTQMAKHQKVVYLSGWAASSMLTTASNEVGPDLAYVWSTLYQQTCSDA